MISMSIQIGCFINEITKVDEVHVRVASRMIKNIGNDDFSIDFNDGYIADYRQLKNVLGKAYYEFEKWMKRN